MVSRYLALWGISVVVENIRSTSGGVVDRSRRWVLARCRSKPIAQFLEAGAGILLVLWPEPDVPEPPMPGYFQSISKQNIRARRGAEGKVQYAGSPMKKLGRLMAVNEMSEKVVEHKRQPPTKNQTV